MPVVPVAVSPYLAARMQYSQPPVSRDHSYRPGYSNVMNKLLTAHVYTKECAGFYPMPERFKFSG